MSQILLVQGTAQRLPLADNSIHCLVTSPPYFGLRTYAGLEPEAWPGGLLAQLPGTAPVAVAAETVCLGNEQAVESYLWHTVLWLREAWRVLRDDGVCWVVIGDSYAGKRGTATTTPGYANKAARGDAGLAVNEHRDFAVPDGSLLLIPHRVALAAVADGWVVRNDVVWSKKSAMPESVSGTRWQPRPCPCLTSHRVLSGQQGHASQGHREHLHGGLSVTPSTLADADCPTCGATGFLDELELRHGSWRHTRAHEQVFMLTKQMGYFANGEAVKEASVRDWGQEGGSLLNRTGWATAAGRHDDTRAPGTLADTSTRNPRSVLTPTPSNLNLAHYASFPPSLIEPLIRATCPERVCTACGAPWVPVVRRSTTVDPAANGARFARGKTAHHGHVQQGERFVREVLPLAPSCYCPPETPPRPGVCLDPFAGSGTTLLICRVLERTGIGLEASAKYLPLSRERLGWQALDVWEGTASRPPDGPYTDLPLFTAEAKEQP